MSNVSVCEHHWVPRTNPENLGGYHQCSLCGVVGEHVMGKHRCVECNLLMQTSNGARI